MLRAHRVSRIASVELISWWRLEAEDDEDQLSRLARQAHERQGFGGKPRVRPTPPNRPNTQKRQTNPTSAVALSAEPPPRVRAGEQ